MRFAIKNLVGGYKMIVLIIVAILLITILTILAIYNNLVIARNKVKQAESGIDVYLNQRFDLIPNLVETVKGYASHEKELLESITASRTGFMNAGSNGEKMDMDNQLTSSLRTLFAVAENYPDLKANKNFENLQNELSETEDKVAYSRQFYNDSVTMYNDKLQMFPTNIIAGMFGFKEEALFATSEEAKEAPKVQF